MSPSVVVLGLNDPNDWNKLHKSIDKSLQNIAVAKTIEQLKTVGAKTVIIENEYLDKDYSEEFSAFYAKLFRRYYRHARRMNFFVTDSAELLKTGRVSDIASALEGANKRGEYLGFMVIRPVQDAPLGRAVLKVLRPPSPGIGARLQVRAKYETHLLGATLQVEGMPFTQQDTRISACAQASIWMSGRHFHTKHRGSWFSTVDITRAASQPHDMALAMSLPAGAGGLGINNMVRALRAMERHPFVHAAGEPASGGPPAWPATLQPQAILARYVESGIPVIAALKSWQPNQDVGHAVVVVGTTFQPQTTPQLTGPQPNVAEFRPYFLVHDDQRGMYLRMPVKPGAALAETPYNVTEHLYAIMIPLPDKVFITAEAAERLAWDYLDKYTSDWQALKTQHSSLIGGSITLGDRVLTAMTLGEVIGRTYLTFGWKYKERLRQNMIAESVRDVVLSHEMPKMVWVTEFGLATDMNKIEPAERRIFGHCVVDATSTGPFHPPLVFHAPGFLWLWSQVPPTFFANSNLAIYPIADEVLYLPRFR